ncbi:hypothetical protein ThidrDRAFT_4717, partial [Thiorhodococcus drewsii AZ1]
NIRAGNSWASHQKQEDRYDGSSEMQNRIAHFRFEYAELTPIFRRLLAYNDEVFRQ